MKFTLRHRYTCTPAHFWDEVFFTEAYTEPLYQEGLGFEAVDVSRLERASNGDVTRTMTVRPRLEMPKAIKRLLGGALSYVEEGRYDAAAGRFHNRMVLSAMADKIDILTDMWLEPYGQDESERVAAFEINVRVFGVGRVVEKFIERSVRESYDKAADFTNRWLMRRWGE